MATAQAAAAEEQRQAVTGLTLMAGTELASVMQGLVGAPADVATDALLDVLPAIGDTYRSAAAALAADYFDEQRSLSGVGGRFEATPEPPVESARWEALARWGVDPLRVTPKTPQVDDDGDPVDFGPDAEPDYAAAQTLLEGGLTRTIADGHRLTVVNNSNADPQARGWMRVAQPGACDFCRMLADRVSASGNPGVYTKASAAFKAHDHCQCVVAPSWDKSAREVVGTPFRASQRKEGWSEKQREQDRAAVRRYLAEHYGADGESKPSRSRVARVDKTAPSSLAGKSDEWLERQITLTASLKFSDWQVKQLARLRAELASR